ncbi:MAG: sulfatase-like hydrolase/transferase [Selenomonadaceae bacterium]|nr:sulfatase-like hydrolase/transferase [Selenomonadaceae bacterium]
MEEYNESKSPEMLEFLGQQSRERMPYDMRMLYEHNRQKLKVAISAQFPTYEDLPIRLYAVSGKCFVVFDKENDAFLVDESINPWHDLYAMMMRQGCTLQSLCQAYRYCFRQERADVARRQLMDMVQRKVFGQDYLDRLDDLLKYTEDDAIPSFFAGRYAFAYGDYALALEYALKAYRKRCIQPEIWKLLVDAYEALGRDEEAVVYKGLIHEHSGHIYGKDLDLSDVSRQRAYCLGHINVTWVPFYWEIDIADGYLRTNFRPANGEVLLSVAASSEPYRYWCGVYNPDNFFDTYSQRCDIYRAEKVSDVFSYSNFMFDIVKARLMKETSFHPDDAACVVSVAGTKEKQALSVQTAGQEGFSLPLGKHEFRHLRVEKDTRISSTDEFAVSRPVLMRHDPARKKLVLNVLLDGLSWGQMKKEGYRHIPNLMKFFSKGIIFDNNYSVAEYTFPSLATIETGMHMHRSQVFDNQLHMSLDEQYRTISEQMSDLGYYCVNVIGDGNGIYNGVTRGFDRLITAPFLKHPSHEGIRRTIEHLEAFPECDNFVFMHVSDPHAFHPNYVPVSPYVQAKLPVEKFFYAKSSDGASVRVSGKEFVQVENLHMIQRMDWELKALWEYLEEHYAEDEYIVHLYSDHGTSAYTEKPYYFSEEQCCSALMLRGAGVPAVGHAEELTSCLDLYAIMMESVGFPHVPYQLDSNLPAALGGQARDFVISNSIFPGQTYKLCIRTADHEFRLETVEPTRTDGTIDMTHYFWRMFRRGNTREEIFDDLLKDSFMNIAYEHVKSFQHV